MAGLLDLKQLTKLSRDIASKPFKRLEEKVFTILLKTHAYYFENEISPQRRKWEPLAESTIQRKGHDTILVDTGDLKASLTERRKGIRTVDRRGDTLEIAFGSDVEYLQYHQTGTSRMPARPALGLPPGTAQLILETTADHIMEQLR